MRLVAGVGGPGGGACWMAAIQYYVSGGADWHDHPECVSAVVRALCIQLNDTCPDGERERLIGPHLFTPLGTAGMEKAHLSLLRSKGIIVLYSDRDHTTLYSDAAIDLSTLYDYLHGPFDVTTHSPRSLLLERHLALILELCAIGERKEVVGCKTREQVIAEACV